MLAQIAVTPEVACRLGVCRMLAAVQFDHEPVRVAAEVGDVRSNRNLSAEVRPVQNELAPKMRP